MLRLGDIVQTWFDTGGGKGAGPQILYGRVVKPSGSKRVTVEWESGLRNRIASDDHRVKIADNPENARFQ